MPSATQTISVRSQTDTERVVKRQRVAADQQPATGAQSRTRSTIFAPYRTVGLISPTDVPFSTVPLGKTTFQITTCIGRSLQTYDLRRGLQLIFITRPQTPEPITAVVTWNDKVLAAWSAQGDGKSCGIWAFKRGKKVSELHLPPGCEPIKQLVIFGSWIVGCGQTRIEVWRVADLEHYTTLYPHQSGHGMLLTGGLCTMPTYLNKIFAGRANGTVEIWNISTGRLLYTILPASSDQGAITALESAPALHHLAIGYSSGPVVIHNVRTDRSLLSINDGGREGDPVTSMSFRSDGLGAGEDGRKGGVMATASSANGDINFWDLNNGGRKMGVLRSAHTPPSSPSSTTAVPGGITRVEFLAGQAVLVSSGADNALKTWIFDEMPFSPVPRILHERRGHSAPISKLLFLPPASDGTEDVGKWLLSASNDRSLWGWSLRRDGQSTELSQGHVKKKARKMGLMDGGYGRDSGFNLESLKAPPITCIACGMNRDGGIGAMPGNQQIWKATGKGKPSKQQATLSSITGWESVVTGHENDKFARTWFWGRKRAGRWMFETGDSANVTSVSMSACGTFAVVGSAAGGIDMFNLQSGIHRQRFPPRLTTVQAKRLKAHQMEVVREPNDGRQAYLRGVGKHTKAVTGIEVDNLNRNVISCGEDGKIKFWDFGSGLLLHELDWSATSISGMRYHRASDLIALTCADGAVRVVDIETKKLVRELRAGTAAIEDFAFSNDGRWIIAASADTLVRVWDLSTGHLIEALRFRSKPSAIAFSNTGEFLATAHKDSVGVQLWTNRALFAHVSTRQISASDIADMDAPTASGEGGHGLLEAATTDETVEEDMDEVAAPSIEQLSRDLLTLSLTPKTQVQTMMHLDTIRQRNKPKEPPKAPQKAPFFLPSMIASSKLEQQSKALVVDQPAEPEQQKEAISRISKIPNPSTAHTSTFTSLLHDRDYAGAVSHLSSLPPSSTDLAIRTLDPSPPYSELVAFLDALTARLKQRRDYELIEAWVTVFLRCHGDVLMESADVRDALERWRAESESAGKRVEDMVSMCRGVGGWVGGVI